MRRIVAVLAVASGLTLIVFTFLTSAFLRLGDGEQVLDRMRGAASAQGFSAFAAGYTETLNGVNELVAKGYPAFADTYGMQTAQFTAYLESAYPALTYGVATVDALPTLVGPFATGVTALGHGGFEPVYNTPIKQLPLSSIPWLLLGVGFALVLAGLAAWKFRPRFFVGVVAVIGLAMVVGPFAMSLPSKADRTARVVALADIGLSPDSVLRSERAVYAAEGMIREFNEGLLPALAKRSGISPAAAHVKLAATTPAFAKLLTDWPTISAGSFGLAENMRASAGEFDEAKGFPFKTAPWLAIALGAGLLLVSGAVLEFGRRRGAATPAGVPSGVPAE